MTRDEGREALLDALDRVREVRGSLPIFDALVSGGPPEVAAALTAWPRHPLRAQLVAWLQANSQPEPPADSPLAALERHGVHDVDAWVAEQEAARAKLERALSDTAAARDHALRSANAYALVAAVLAVLAIGGWVVALGAPEPEAAVNTSGAAPP